jgi:2-polyprenyl-3-methyl-5-hydroxy-6-metoxy-1,4-benzoquinol methylase
LSDGFINTMKNNLDVHVAAYKGDNIYDFDNEILLTWYPQRVLMNASEATSILELGVGHGFTTNIFSNNFDRHVVLEGSPAIIQNFKEKFPECNAEIVETYFENFYTDEKFDVIVMGFILEHVDNPYEIIRRYKKFLSPGGKFFLAVPNAEVLNRRLGHLAGMLEDMTALSENDFQQGHKRYYTVASLAEEINRAGFKIDRLEGIYLKPLTTSQIITLKLDERIIHALCKIGVDYPELSCAIFAQISEK